VTAQHVVFESGPREVDDLARSQIHVDAERAGAGAGAALDAVVQILAARHRHDLIGEFVVSVRVVPNVSFDAVHIDLRGLISCVVELRFNPPILDSFLILRIFRKTRQSHII
jgi:hypothetical protein